MSTRVCERFQRCFNAPASLLHFPAPPPHPAVWQPCSNHIGVPSSPLTGGSPDNPHATSDGGRQGAPNTRTPARRPSPAHNPACVIARALQCPSSHTTTPPLRCQPSWPLFKTCDWSKWLKRRSDPKRCVTGQAHVSSVAARQAHVSSVAARQAHVSSVAARQEFVGLLVSFEILCPPRPITNTVWGGVGAGGGVRVRVCVRARTCKQPTPLLSPTLNPTPKP